MSHDLKRGLKKELKVAAIIACFKARDVKGKAFIASVPSDSSSFTFCRAGRIMFWKAERLKSCYTGIKNASSLPRVWHGLSWVTESWNKAGG